MLSRYTPTGIETDATAHDVEIVASFSSTRPATCSPAPVAAIEAKGGMKRYLADELKLTDTDIEMLKKRYLRD